MKKNLLLLIISILLFGFSLEIVVRLKDAKDGFGFFSSHRDLTKKMKPIVPFRTFGHNLYQDINGERYVISTHNERYSLAKKKNTFRIVALGGSATKNFIDGVHYPLLLEQSLKQRYPQKNIEVINVAEDGYATPHSLILFELNVLSWNPDLVIVMDNINDLQAAYFPSFTFDYGHKYGDPSFLPDYRARFTLSNIFFHRSHFYWMLKDRLARVFSFKQKTPYQRISYGMEPPLLSQEIFRRNLEIFITIAKANGIGVVFSTQALEPSEEYWERAMQYKSYNDRVRYPFHEEFVAHVDVFNDIIRSMAEERNVYVIDNSASLAGDRQYFVDYVHYTKKGVEKIADNFFRFIVSKRFIVE